MGKRSITTVLLLELAMFSLALPARGQASDTAVVVSAGNPVTNISITDLRKTFAGMKRSWPSGQPIKLIVRGPGCPERVVLLKLLAIPESQYKQYWTAQVFRGEVDAEPLIVPSVGMQKEALALYPGAISLVNFSDVKPGMKVIKVDGQLPGAVGYPLH
jgi:hypothetical protein